MKLYSRVLYARLKVEAQNLHEFTMGFRPGFQPYEFINSMRVSIEKAVEWHNPLCCAKLDVAKAFDSVSHPHLFAALQRA
eukprot:12323723-Heterocapsa_arctica.AAC.1